MQTAFDTYTTSANPDKVLLDTCTILSQATGEFSLISQDLTNQMSNVTKFLTETAKSFPQNRNPKIYPNSTPEVKQIFDQGLLTAVLQNYVDTFHLDPNKTLANIDQDTKDSLFFTIISFTDTIYADDLTGASLFGKKIADAKSKYVTYQSILDHPVSEANIIPVCK